MSGSEKVDRRTALKIVSGTVAGLVIGGVMGYLAKPAEVAKETVTKVVTETIRETVTVTGIVTPTITPPTTPAYPPGLGPEDEPYLKGMYQLIDWIGGVTVLSPRQLEEELIHYVRASKPYRGQTLHIMYEAVPGAVWEDLHFWSS